MKEKELCLDQSMASINGSTSPGPNNNIGGSGSGVGDCGPSMIPAINRINHTSCAANSTLISSNSYLTPRSFRNRNHTFQSMPIVHTPTPPSRQQKIINPFEVGLPERLNMHFIGSPSLFHRAETPKHCSTPTHDQFDGWTIDDVSSLNPATVEAYETQFTSQNDPDFEAKAQAAISSFFKEQIMVPSPNVNGADGKAGAAGQRSLFKYATATAAAAYVSATGSDTPSTSQTKKRKRDNATQTELTLPPILPADVEAALKPYFTYTQNQQQCVDDVGDISMNSLYSNSDTTIDYEARDASLRRKLFHNSPGSSDVSDTEYPREELQLDSPPPQTPDMLENVGKMGRFSNGCINHDEPFSDFDDIFDSYDENAYVNSSLADDDILTSDDSDEIERSADGDEHNELNTTADDDGANDTDL